MNIVSFGGGTNSAAMLIGMYQRGIPVDLITFADTGGERPHTCRFIETFNAWLEGHGLPRIVTVFYTNRDGERMTLEAESLKSHTLPSIAYGFKKCSLKHKASTQEKYCNHDPRCQAEWAAGRKVHKFIGYDAGETRRVQHAAPADALNSKYEFHYPLFEWGWTRDDCKRIIVEAGLPAPGKSSCFFCPSMKKAEIVELWEQYPDLWERALAIERNAAPTLKTVKGLVRSWSWEDFYAEYMRNKEFEDAQITFDSLFPDSPGGCLCGAPCGCYDG